MRRAFLILTLAIFATSSASPRGTGQPSSPAVGAVYTMSNAAAGNAVLVFERLADGHLLPAGSAATGGNGTGGGLGNQGGVTLTGGEDRLLVVNAGSDTISAFDVHKRTLQLTDVEPSGGDQPVSVTAYRDLVYTLNAGSDSIAGFRLDRDGRLHALSGSVRPLSGAATGPAQISFSPGGDVLVVTEKNTNRIVTFRVDRDGLPGPLQIHASSGPTPFGFAFGKRDQLLVSEAVGGAVNASATSSYRVDSDGGLTTISASVGTNQTANCWVIVTPSGRFAYVTNTGSGSISGYRIAFDGEIELVDANGITGVTGGGPIDLALADNGRFLYALVSGTNAIAAFAVEADGSLTPLPSLPGLPASANGLAAR